MHDILGNRVQILMKPSPLGDRYIVHVCYLDGPLKNLTPVLYLNELDWGKGIEESGL